MGFGEAGNGHGLVMASRKAGNRGEAFRGDCGIDFIADDPDLLCTTHFQDGSQGFRRINGTRGIVRRIEQYRPGFWSDRFFNRLGIRLKPHFRIGWNGDQGGTSRGYRGRIGGII